MQTYQSLRTKDDDLFLKHARRVLRGEFDLVMQDAAEAFKKHSRPSEAKQAANLVILAALKDIGEEHWRKPKEEKVDRIEVKPAALPQKKQNLKYSGKSILEMGEESLKKMRGSNKL